MHYRTYNIENKTIINILIKFLTPTKVLINSRKQFYLNTFTNFIINYSRITKIVPYCLGIQVKDNLYTIFTLFKWGMDILSPFSLVLSQLKFILVGVCYFTKWVEAKAIAKITTKRVRHFYCTNIIYHFGLPKFVVFDNGTQLASSTMIELNAILGIQKKFISIEHS